ncbi:MAG: glycosyltransferase [Planctomycetes bacterium]|nr:glycosyltransferase [Planctomycetota bacterium]
MASLNPSSAAGGGNGAARSRRVFLGNAPWNAPGKYGVRAGSRWPHFEEEGFTYMPFPFFMAYASAVLEESGLPTLMVDGIAEGITEEAFLARLTAFAPEVTLLEVSTPSIDTDLAFARRVRAALPATAIVFAGLHATMHEPAFLDAHPFVDFCLIGEYDYTLRDLCLALEAGGAQATLGVAGLLGRDPGTGRAVSTGRRPTIDDLDALPWPSRHMLPMDRYHDEPGGIPQPSAQMWASRGCPYTCNFCAWPQIVYANNRYRVRSPRNIVDEMEWLTRECGFRSVYFDDDTFNIGKNRMRDLADEILRRGIRIPWGAMCRADTVDADTLRRLFESGLAAVKFGVESADQRVVDECGKKLRLETLRRMVKCAHDLGVKTHLTFMFGLPGETIAGCRKTLDLALELAPDTLQFSIATPFPGSRLYHDMEARGQLTTLDYAQYDGQHKSVIDTGLIAPGELDRFAEHAHRVWKEFTARRRREPAAARPYEAHASVVAPVYNGAAHLPALIESLVAQTARGFDVVFVDDGSSDGSASLIARLWPEGRAPARVLVNGENQGFARAANRGIQAAPGRYVALVNQDVTLAADWLERCSRALDENPTVGLVACRVMEGARPERVFAAGDGFTRSGVAFQAGSGRLLGPEWLTPRRVFGATAAAAMYRRRMLDHVGLFDEEFEMYLEDVDLAFRAQLWGYECLYLPDAVATHAGHSTSPGGERYSARNVFQIARNTVSVMVKNVPRRILLRHAPRIVGRAMLNGVYHAVASRHPLAFARGTWAGLRAAPAMAKKRRAILGAKVIPDERVYALMLEAEADWAKTRRAR